MTLVTYDEVFDLMVACCKEADQFRANSYNGKFIIGVNGLDFSFPPEFSAKFNEIEFSDHCKRGTRFTKFDFLLKNIEAGYELNESQREEMMKKLEESDYYYLPDMFVAPSSLFNK